MLHAEKLIAEIVRSVPIASGFGAAVVDFGAKRPVFPEGASAKRQRMDEGDKPTNILVPARSAGAVVGKQGSNLKQLRESYGVHVEMLQLSEAPQWPNDRVVTLKGTTPAKQAAVNALLHMAFQTDEPSVTLKMLVPSAEAGSVIGKQSSTLKYREQTGVPVQVERDEVMGERLVVATGAMAQVIAAAVLVVSTVDGGKRPGL